MPRRHRSRRPRRDRARASARDRPVVVGVDRSAAERLADALPTGTELALTTSGSTAATAARPASWRARAPRGSRRPPRSPSSLARPTTASRSPGRCTSRCTCTPCCTRCGSARRRPIASRRVRRCTRRPRASRAPRRSTRRRPRAIVAGAAMGPAVRARVAERGIRLTEYYGAAELPFVLAGNGWKRRRSPASRSSCARARRATSSGRGRRTSHVGGGGRRDAAARRPRVRDGRRPRGAHPDGIRVLAAAMRRSRPPGRPCPPSRSRRGWPRCPACAVAVVGEPHELLGSASRRSSSSPRTPLEGSSRRRGPALARGGPRRWFVHALPRTTPARSPAACCATRSSPGPRSGPPAPFEAGAEHAVTDRSPVIVAPGAPRSRRPGAVRRHTVDALAAPVLAAAAPRSAIRPGRRRRRARQLHGSRRGCRTGRRAARRPRHRGSGRDGRPPVRVGLDAVMQAASRVRAGDAALVIAGGAESASTAPHRLRPDTGERYTRAPFAPAASPTPTWARPPSTSRASAASPARARTPGRRARTARRGCAGRGVRRRDRARRRHRTRRPAARVDGPRAARALRAGVRRRPHRSPVTALAAAARSPPATRAGSPTAPPPWPSRRRMSPAARPAGARGGRRGRRGDPAPPGLGAAPRPAPRSPAPA